VIHVLLKWIFRLLVERYNFYFASVIRPNKVAPDALSFFLLFLTVSLPTVFSVIKKIIPLKKLAYLKTEDKIGLSALIILIKLFFRISIPQE
jgi:hypothetical protein